MSTQGTNPGAGPPPADPSNPITIFQNWLDTGDDLAGDATLESLWDQFQAPLDFDPVGVTNLVRILGQSYPQLGITAGTVNGFADLDDAISFVS